MKPDVIREIAEKEAERACQTLRGDQRLACLTNNRLWTTKKITEALRILEQAGYVVVPKEELEAALKGMLAHACVADAAPEDKDADDHEAERRARAMLAALTQEGRG